MEKLAQWIEKILMGVGVEEGMAPYLRLLILPNHCGNFGLGFLQIHTMDSQRTCTEVRKTLQSHLGRSVDGQ